MFSLPAVPLPLPAACPPLPSVPTRAPDLVPDSAPAVEKEEDEG